MNRSSSSSAPRRNRLPALPALAITALIGLPALSSSDAARTSLDWRAHIGINGINQTAWASWVRGVGRNKTGDSAQLEALRSAVRLALEQSSSLLMPLGGIDSGRDAAEVGAYLKAVRADRGKAWKETVAEQVITVAGLLSPTQKVTWQIGNEINGERISANLLGREQNRASDPKTIPVYVEEYLAPSVEAIGKISRDRFGADDRISVMLGSVANAGSEASRIWLDQLLAYKVVGTNAPTLAGKAVSELVDLISIHYLVTQGGPDWARKLEDIWKKWVGVGRIKGVWQTEEQGKQRANAGYGASTTLRVTARNLHFFGTRGIQATQGRVAFWGWDLGAPDLRGEDGVTAFAETVGRGVVRETAIPDQQAGLERYDFASLTEPSKRATIVFPIEVPNNAEEGFSDRDFSVTVTGLNVDGAGRGASALRVRLLGANGIREIAASVAGGRIRLGAALELQEKETLLVQY